MTKRMGILTSGLATELLAVLPRSPATAKTQVQRHQQEDVLLVGVRRPNVRVRGAVFCDLSDLSCLYQLCFSLV
jgi:hypothetical protein